MLTMYCNGVTLGTPPQRKQIISASPKRGETKGWTTTATRNNTKFLYSVDTQALTGYGVAFTFTVKELPPSPADWNRLRDSFLQHCRRMGLIRYHWVTEWQRRGVPHLHGCLYFDSPKTLNDMRHLSSHWCKLAKKYGASYLGQHVVPIQSATGWLNYLSKHASRGVKHYQRASKPASWLNTGRVWGKGGDWPVNAVYAQLDRPTYWILRRLIKNWRKSDARVIRKGIVYASRISRSRRVLKCSNRGASSCRGMSEWIPQELSLMMLAASSAILKHQHTRENRVPTVNDRLRAYKRKRAA